MSLNILLKDIFSEYLLSFGYEDLIKLIHLKNPTFSEIINNEFWRRKYIRDFGRLSDDSVVSWQETYEVKFHNISNYLAYAVDG